MSDVFLASQSIKASIHTGPNTGGVFNVVAQSSKAGRGGARGEMRRVELGPGRN